MAKTSDEVLRDRRRKKLAGGLALGGLALGIPAIINAIVARRARQISEHRWSSSLIFPWRRGDIAYRRLGDRGPRVVLAHSLGPGHDSAEWEGVAESLAGYCRVFVPDFLGFGESERPRERYSDALYLELVRDFIDHCRREGEKSRELNDSHHLEPVVYCGVGHTAAYGVRLALEDPAAFAALVLVAPTGLDERDRRARRTDRALFNLLRLPVLGASALNIATSRKAIRAHLENEVFADPDHVSEKKVLAAYRSSHQAGALNVLSALLAGHLHHALGVETAALAVPTLLAWGRHCRIAPIENADLWMNRLPDAKLTVYEESGLLPHVEQPARFEEDIARFLDNVFERRHKKRDAGKDPRRDSV